MPNTNHDLNDQPQELTLQEPPRPSQMDHAFPMLSANKSTFPPEFRFMWASR